MIDAAKKQDKTYQVSKSLHFSFDAVQDRLIVESVRGADAQPVKLSLTRRMVILVLKQLLNHLPEMAQLKQTPSQYWEDVLRMSHQQALEAHQKKGTQTKASASAKTTSAIEQDNTAAEQQSMNMALEYLANEVVAKIQNEKLILAFNGFDLQADNDTATSEQVFATVLEVEQIHQLIQLLINKAHLAMWHLPVDLSWVEQPGKSPRSSRETMQFKH